MGERLTIGQLAQETQLDPKTIRYYEQIGLVPQAQRASSGYRIYGDDAVRRLTLIRRARMLGLNLTETKGLTAHLMEDSCNSFQHRLNGFIGAKMAEIDQRIAELSTLRSELSRIAVTFAKEDGSLTEPVMECTECGCQGPQEFGEGGERHGN